MKIRMITLAAGPDRVLLATQEYDLPAEVAQPLVDGGYAESLEPAAEADSASTGEGNGVEDPPANPDSTGEAGETRQ